jgi:RNA polymerase sigma-70 factor (ECF subfamily)
MEPDLVVRAQNGDRAAFTTLATALHDRMHRVAENILADRQLAEDATQSAFLAMWRNLPSLREPARFEAWSYRTLVHACYAERRGIRRWVPNLFGEAPELRANVDGLGAVADRDELERGFRRLSFDQRAVVVLHHYLDLPLEQVADVLGVPLGTAHSRLHRAMQAMRAALEADAREATTVRSPGEVTR